MKLVSVKKAVLFSVGAICISIPAFFTCNSSNSPVTPTPDAFADFEVPNQQISGWSMDTVPANRVGHFTQLTLNNFCDGGNKSYCGDCAGSSGLKAGVHYVMVDTAKQASAEIYVMDYGTADSAKAEFDNRSTDQLAYSTKDTIGSFPNTVAVGAEHSGGIKAMAFFGKYYFEMTFLGYDPSASSDADANLFLTFFQSKVK